MSDKEQEDKEIDEEATVAMSAEELALEDDAVDIEELLDTSATIDVEHLAEGECATAVEEISREDMVAEGSAGTPVQEFDYGAIEKKLTEKIDLDIDKLQQQIDEITKSIAEKLGDLKEYIELLEKHQDNLANLQKLDELKALDSLQKLEQLGVLEKLDNLEKLDQLSKLDMLQHLEMIELLDKMDLERFNALRDLQRLDELEKLERLAELQNLEKLELLTKLENMQNLDKLSQLEELMNSEAWGMLDKFGFLRDNIKSIKLTLVTSFVTDILKVVIIAALVVFATLYTVSNDKMNSLLAYIGLENSAAINLTLPILHKTSTEKRFKEVYALTKKRLIAEIDTFWNLHHERSASKSLDKLHYIMSVHFKLGEQSLEQEIRTYFNDYLAKAQEQFELEFDNVSAMLKKRDKRRVLLRRVKLLYFNQQCEKSFKLSKQIDFKAANYLKNLAQTLNIVCIYQQQKGDYQQTKNIIMH